jgi:hypothetical protein
MDDDSLIELIVRAKRDLKLHAKLAEVLSTKVADVLRQLPVLPEKEPLIDPLAKAIADTFVGVQHAVDLGFLKQVGEKAARRHAIRLAKYAQKLAAGVKFMPIALIEATNLKELARPENVTEFLLPNLALCRALERLTEVLCDAAGTIRPANKGRPISRPAVDVADMAARAFTLLTGKPAMPGSNAYMGKRSDFEQFLLEVNQVFGIEANTENLAKSLRDKKRKK